MSPFRSVVCFPFASTGVFSRRTNNGTCVSVTDTRHCTHGAASAASDQIHATKTPTQFFFKRGKMGTGVSPHLETTRFIHHPAHQKKSTPHVTYTPEFSFLDENKINILQEWFECGSLNGRRLCYDAGALGVVDLPHFETPHTAQKDSNSLHHSLYAVIKNCCCVITTRWDVHTLAQSTALLSCLLLTLALCERARVLP